jgi:hypothetical protein
MRDFIDAMEHSTELGKHLLEDPAYAADIVRSGSCATSTAALPSPRRIPNSNWKARDALRAPQAH